MTITELPSGNGAKLPYEPPRTINDRVDDRRETAYARYVADGGTWTIAKVAAELDLGQRQAGTVSREWKRRLAANGGSPASEVLPPPKPAPRAISKASPATKNRRLVLYTKIAVVLVTAVAALLSYSGLRKLAVEAGLGWHADILPLAVDGLVAVCLLVRAVMPHNRVAWVAGWLALIGSVAANAYVYGHPWNTPLLIIAATMAGFTPFAAGVGYHLLGRMLKESR